MKNNVGKYFEHDIRKIELEESKVIIESSVTCKGVPVTLKGIPMIYNLKLGTKYKPTI